jgi:hypothetical protein
MANMTIHTQTRHGCDDNKHAHTHHYYHDSTHASTLVAIMTVPMHSVIGPTRISADVIYLSRKITISIYLLIQAYRGSVPLQHTHLFHTLYTTVYTSHKLRNIY